MDLTFNFIFARVKIKRMKEFHRLTMKDLFYIYIYIYIYIY